MANIGKYLAFANMALSLGASIGYAFAKDPRHAIYWASAFVLTGSVTF